MACALVALAVSCSDNKASIPPPRALDKSAAIDTGDAVCKQYAADRKQLIDTFKASHSSPSADEARDFLVNTLVPRTERMVGDFHRIGEPTKDRTGWDRIVRALDDDLTDFKAGIGDDPVAQIDERPFAKDTKLFDDYGFKECGKQLA